MGVAGAWRRAVLLRDPSLEKMTQAAEIKNTSARLSYRDLESGGSANINLRNGDAPRLAHAVPSASAILTSFHLYNPQATSNTWSSRFNGSPYFSTNGCIWSAEPSADWRCGQYQAVGRRHGRVYDLQPRAFHWGAHRRRELFQPQIFTLVSQQEL
jgi:hypothetical protein